MFSIGDGESNYMRRIDEATAYFHKIITEAENRVETSFQINCLIASDFK